MRLWRRRRGGVRFGICSLPRPTYPHSLALSVAPHPLALVQGLKYLELGPAAGAAELVDCAINLVVVTGVREAAAAEAAGSGRAWGTERKGGRGGEGRKREEEREREKRGRGREGGGGGIIKCYCAVIISHTS